jgi:hypothetical protein
MRAGLLRGHRLRTDDAQRLGDAGAIGGIGLGAVGDMPLLDMLGGLADLAGRVVEQHLLLLRVHLPEQIARLLPVIVINPVIPMGGGAADLERRFVELWLVGPLAQAIGEVGRRSAEIAVGAHGAVTVIAVEWTFWCVDRDVVVIDAEAVALRIAVGEQTPLQHLVGRIADARHDVGGRESGLFDFGENVFGVPVELEISTSISGKSPLGQTLVRSKGLNGKAFAWASVITWMKSVQRGKFPASMLPNRSR